MQATRRAFLTLCVSTVLLVGPASPSPAGTPPHREPTVALTGFEHGLLADINAVRLAHRLSPLQYSVQLGAAAREHSTQMALDGYFAHASADGLAFWRRIEQYYGAGAGPLWAVGENLLWESPTVGARRAVAMWLHSAEHRRNLLGPRWREIGIAAVRADAAPGVFGGHEVTIVTADFGVRS